MKITTINTIEVSSICDNSCQYCPASIQSKHRQVGYMTMSTFKTAIDWVLHFCRRGSQRELNLFGVGEPTLHPDIVDLVAYARNKLPFRQKIHLNTNGNTMTKKLAIALKKAGITSIDITAHHAYSAAKTIRIFQEVGIDGALSLDFVTRPNNWAGQVDWFEPAYHKAKGWDCPWLNHGQVMVMSNGDVTTCCIDAFGQGVFAHVNDDLIDKRVEAQELCHKCHHIVPQNQRLIHAVGG